jgi:hypothetical protein
MTDITTLLTLSGDNLPPYSARGLRQTLEPIGQASALHRSVNGRLLNFAPSQFQLFKTEISGNDQQAPALTKVWPGTPITVSTVAELAYLTANNVPERLIAGSFIDGDYTFYRLVLNCIVVNWNLDKAEWEAMTGWRIDLEEA